MKLKSQLFAIFVIMFMSAITLLVLVFIPEYNKFIEKKNNNTIVVKEKYNVYKEARNLLLDIGYEERIQDTSTYFHKKLNRKVQLLLHSKDYIHITTEYKGDETWQSIKEIFMLYYEFISSKYYKGKLDTGFKAPYIEGDGYELQAVNRDKCNYTSLWNEGSDFNILLFVSKHGIIITYIGK